MKRKLVGILITISLLAAGQALAADKWLKKRNPEELYAYVDINNCPLSTADVMESVHSKLVRSRIKPLSEWNSGDVVLYAVLDCASEKTDSWIFTIMVMPAKITREGRDNTVVSFRQDDQIQSFGKGGESFVTDNLNKAIDTAFMNYLNANFDLGPDD